MFPWSDTCLFKRLKKQKRLSDKETEVLNLWKADVCSGGELPEIEIVSLLEEQIPKYTLRADTLTEFSGYENQDWFIPCPALKPEDADTSNLSPDTIREILNYFLLCSNRVSQMTKTYNDIEAVTRLLEEKEKDIELTARIGKELLSNNQKLENTVAKLEAELKVANEKITQLQYEVLKKTELIQILTNDVEESASGVETPTGTVNFDVLQRRIGKLEEENVQLRNEASLLAEQTDEVEQQEQKLVSDFASQLAVTRSDLNSATEEAERFREECRMFKRLSDNLTDKLQATEQKLSKSKHENEELTAMLVVTRETQNELANELSELKDRYSEVLGLLQETQEALKKHNKKGIPTIRGGGLFSSLQSSSMFSSHHDSLGTELESSLFSELSLDSGISSDRVPYYKKVFDTVRVASKTSSLGSVSPSQQNSYHNQSSYDSASSVMSYDIRNGVEKRNRKSLTDTSSNRLSYLSDDYVASDSECSDDSAYPGGPREGIPGAPGSADLAEALRRLTPAAVYARRAALSNGTFGGDAFDLECRTPDSIMSTSSFGGGAFANVPWKLPDKLQIVKPIEGSQTLHHWSQLATPSLGGLLDERPGIKTRGCSELEDLGLHVYSLDDVEEDEEVIHPGKSFQESGYIYTFTNSTVMHPNDGTSVTSSYRGSRMSTVSNSRASTTPGTPLRSRRNSTCTFSVTLGLAKLLNERGITAATPSNLVTPSFTPTATPCNSPEGRSPIPTPSHSRSVSPSVAPFSSAFGLPGYLVSSGAEYLRKTLTGGLIEPATHISRSKELRSDTVSKLDKKTLTGIRLMETVEKIGLETLISPVPQHSAENLKILNESRKVVTKSNSKRAADKSKSKKNARSVRPDLGTVLGSVPTCPVTKESTPSQPSSTLGTLSSLLFGRKGGLL